MMSVKSIRYDTDTHRIGAWGTWLAFQSGQRGFGQTVVKWAEASSAHARAREASISETVLCGVVNDTWNRRTLPVGCGVRRMSWKLLRDALAAS